MFPLESSAALIMRYLVLFKDGWYIIGFSKWKQL